MKKLLFTIGLAGMIALNSSAQINIDSGLVAYYSFNGDANDQSGNGNNGTVNGATLTADRFGNANSAYSFDGASNFISIAIDPSLQTDVITITSWIKVSSLAMDWMDIVSYGWGGHVIAVNTSGYLIGGVQGTGPPCELTGLTDVSTGSWFFVVFTRDGNDISHFVNSVQDITDTLCAISPTYDNPVNIGRDPSVSSEHFDGAIDDVRIYNRRLTIGEIQAVELDSNVVGIGKSGNDRMGVLVYPNPVADELNITTSYNESTFLKIYNILGEQINSVELKDASTKVSTDQLSIGTYFYQIVNSKGIVINKGEFNVIR